MTNKEKSIMVLLCTKLLQYADLEEDKDAKKLVNKVVKKQLVKEHNTKIRNLIG
ncbi:MAG: hypothetical protein RHS_0278 [Robinsoniella sp. RHS]|nr:MAG: hypothetical protein RHS_0278 [Robinsoniella sp. RHS]